MRNDDETTVTQLKAILREQGHNISLSTILRCRSQLGWTYRGLAYCQLIREGNKVKRLEWAQCYLMEGSAGFRDVIFTDETTVQLDPHRRFAYRKAGQPAKPKPRYGMHLMHIYFCLSVMFFFHQAKASCQSTCLGGD